MIVDGDSYTWNPNFIKYKDPENRGYFGTAIGNTPLEEHYAIVDSEADAQKQAILENRVAYTSEIYALSEKFVRMWEIVSEVENAIATYPWQNVI